MKKIKSFAQRLLLLTVPFAFVMASCEEELVGPQVAGTPTATFDYFWKTFDTHYGLFEVKQIDWDEIFRQHRSRITDTMTDEELYQVLTDMMNPLNDNHLNLYATNGTLPVYPGGIFKYENGKPVITKVQEDFDLEVAKRYLIDYQQITPNVGYGKLPHNVYYLNIKGTDGLKQVEKQMEKALMAMADASGLIIDIRGFYGGYDPVSQYLAGCFASSRSLYMTTRKRNGPNHGDFTPALEWYVEPKPHAFTKPIVVLTSLFTQSAGETFLMAMKTAPHVKTVGGTTAGSLSDNPNFELPNGWMFSVSVGDYRAADGKSYEGIGLTPDVVATTTREDLLAGKDPVLERALEILK